MSDIKLRLTESQIETILTLLRHNDFDIASELADIANPGHKTVDMVETARMRNHQLTDILEGTLRRYRDGK